MNLKDKSQFPKLQGIYKITNVKTKKCYIGSAVNLKLRLQRHLYEFEKNLHNNLHLQRIFNKYGFEIFEVEILELFDIIEYKELLKIESNYINIYNSYVNGYNLMLDNSSHFKKLNKNKKNIENNKKRNSKHVCLIDIHTNKLEYTFDSISDAGRFLNTSTSNISQVCKNKANYLKGYNFCYREEYDINFDYRKPLFATKNRKISEAHRLKIEKASQLSKGKNVFQYDKNYVFINEFPSMKKAEEYNNLKKESLRRRLDNKTPFEGFYWLSTKI
jgi:hypothetical protein